MSFPTHNIFDILPQQKNDLNETLKKNLFCDKKYNENSAKYENKKINSPTTFYLTECFPVKT